MKRFLLASLVLALFIPLVSGQSLPAASSSDLRIGPRDVLEVQVLQDEKFNARPTVSDEGVITIPMVGKVNVAGLTAREAEQRLKEVLEAKVLRVADVSVQVVQFASRPISVVGAVTKPGSINVTGTMTLIQALTYAGGLSTGYGKTLYVMRTGQNGLTEQLPIDIEDLLINGNPDLNIPLEPNDLVNVQVETPISVYLIGEVIHPGKIELRRTPAASLLQAIAAAGGPTDRAGSRATVKRAGTSKPLSFNFRRIAEGDSPDFPLQDGDTIYIKESFF